MNKFNNHAFVNQLLVCLLVTFCFGGSIGLGTVWLRHQISVTANANRVLKAKIDEVERHISEVSALVEGELVPDVLKRRNEQWRLGLAELSDTQVVHVTEDTGLRLRTRQQRELFGDRPEPLNLQLALRR